MMEPETSERSDTEQLAEELEYVTNIQQSPEARIVFDVSEGFLKALAKELRKRLRDLRA